MGIRIVGSGNKIAVVLMIAASIVWEIRSPRSRNLLADDRPPTAARLC